MRPGYKGAPALVFVLVALLGAVGCGDDVGKEADEGIPIKLGDLEFIVQETRFLNPAQPDDGEYLAGQEVPPPAGQMYLGVFVNIHNESDQPTTLPTDAEVSVTDTTGAAYEALPSETPFAAPLGTELAGGGDIPIADTAAANGPVQAGLVIFLVDEGISENRPLKLELEHEGETGEIVLDI
jgi:hypothetical protein